MQELILMRHAKSDWSAGLPDPQRPLNARGREAAGRMGAWLLAQTRLPDAQACWVSNAVRTQETWELAFVGRPFRSEPRLYLASAEQLDLLIEEACALYGRALLLGHNEGLAEWVFANSKGEVAGFPTAAVAHFCRDSATHAWQLHNQGRPRDLS